jgi:hypothetical protein
MLWAAAIGLVAAGGCAHTLVRPADLPASPAPPPATRGVVLVLDRVPPKIVQEFRSYAMRVGETREVGPADDLTALCPAPGWLVLRPAIDRVHFASNAGDRNALLTFQAARVVLLPVAAASALLWRWYGHTTVAATLDAVRCDDEAPPIHLVASHLVSTTGRGLVRGRTLRDAQVDVATRAVIRELLARLAKADGAPPTVAVQEFATDGAAGSYPDPQAFGLELAEVIAAELRERGYRAVAYPAGARLPPARLTVTGRLTRLEAGSRLKRQFLRFGAGAARLGVAATVTDAERGVVATIEREERAGHGPFGGSAPFLIERCLGRIADAAAERVAGAAGAPDGPRAPS